MKKANYKIAQSLMVVTSFFIAPTVTADWWKTLEEKNGFSEFAPPAPFSNQYDERKRFEWRSGSSMKKFNSDKFSSQRVSKNPWKPVKSFTGKTTFSSHRPWGKVPERKPRAVTNMRLHDQRFKHWVNQVDSSHQNNYLYTGAGLHNSYSQGINPYLLDPLMTRGLHRGGYMPGGYVPFISNGPGIYGIYPVSHHPYSGFPGRFIRW